MTPTWLRLHDRQSGDPCLVRADTIKFIWSHTLAVGATPSATLVIDNGHACVEAPVLESAAGVEAMLAEAMHGIIVAPPAKPVAAEETPDAG